MEFIKTVERFVELHKSILEANKTLKDSKKEKMMLSKEILDYMMSHHMHEQECDGYVILNKEIDKKGKIDLEFVENLLENAIGMQIDQKKIEEIMNAIIEGTPVETKNTLAIKKHKEPKAPKEKKVKATAAE